MIWEICLPLSVLGCVLIPILMYVVKEKRSFKLINSLLIGVFFASLVLFLPVHVSNWNGTFLGAVETVGLCIFNGMQLFTIGTEFSLIEDAMVNCPDWLDAVYQAWSAVLFVLAPVFTFGFVLSLFKNINSYLKCFRYRYRDAYVFSELNDKSLVLAESIKESDKKAVLVFTDVFEGEDEKGYELVEKAKSLGAVFFKKDIIVINFNKHLFKRHISFFAIGENETENLNQSLKLIERYRNRDNTRVYAFSVKLESELLLTAVDKGKVKVRRINEVQSLINCVLYENGYDLFSHALSSEDGVNEISAVVVGMGNHGREMVKALTWYGQMDGYRISIDAFDKDELCGEKFTALAPELMSEKYNGVNIDGEAQYKITVHSGVDVETASFAKKLMELKKTTYVFVSLGNDDVNIKTAVELRMLFERIGAHPAIHAIVYNSNQKKALEGIKNYRGQDYDIDFIGDLESSYKKEVIIDSDLEEDALQRHLKWGKEEEFWAYEYNYRSSVASAIHMKARIECGIPGASKKEEELTEEERLSIETLEHRRWNAYMRAEGYIFSGSKDKKSRNDLAKMHHDLVDYSSLSEEEKRKDSMVGTK